MSKQITLDEILDILEAIDPHVRVYRAEDLRDLNPMTEEEWNELYGESEEEAS